jgi:probable rRNA maturation factor
VSRARGVREASPARISVDVSSTVRRPAISAGRVRELVNATLDAERVRDALVSVAFVGTDTISRLNRDFLGHTGPTDVISFGLARQGSSVPLIGDIYICQRVAARNAKAFAVPLREELARLVVHGTLHILGYDHSDDDARMSGVMWKKQERILDSRR